MVVMFTSYMGLHPEVTGGNVTPQLGAGPRALPGATNLQSHIPPPLPNHTYSFKSGVHVCGSV